MQLTAYPTDGLPDRLELSTIEADRFGLPVSRLQLGSLEGIEPEDVLELFDRSESELCFLRVPAGSEKWIAGLLQRDVTVLPADNLIYYGRGLDDVEEVGSARTASVTDEDELVDAVRSTFADYSNHYRSNPLLRAEDCEEGYVQWCAAHLEADDAAVVLQHAHDGSLAGFGAVKLTGSTGEITLAGVMPQHRGRGAYDMLLASLEHQLSHMGAVDVVISTQSWNVAPMRGWSRRGYLPISAFSTVHLLRGGCRRALLDLVAG